MPKSKKKKHQDFQKVKLKVGKRLPKGDNVTNLSFKTRQIQLTQRIKEDEGQGHFTKKKENVQVCIVIEMIVSLINFYVYLAPR